MPIVLQFLLIGLLTVFPVLAHASTIQVATSKSTPEQASCAYGSASTCVISDTGLPESDKTTCPVPSLDPVAKIAAAKSTGDILVLGRGPLSRLENLAGQQGGRVSTINSTVPKEIFKQNYRDIRSADKIIQYMDNIPTTLEESLQIGGQYSRAEIYMINQRQDLLEKTIRLYENAPAGR
jgi:hypothetical protein